MIDSYLAGKKEIYLATDCLIHSKRSFLRLCRYYLMRFNFLRFIVISMSIPNTAIYSPLVSFSSQGYVMIRFPVLLPLLFMRRFNARLLINYNAVLRFHLFHPIELLPDPDCFLSISSLARDRTLMLFICPTFVDTESFSFRLGCVSPSRGMISPYVAPFRSFPIFTHLRAHLDKLSREAHIYPSPVFLSLAHFNIPSINRTASLHARPALSTLQLRSKRFVFLLKPHPWRIFERASHKFAFSSFSLFFSLIYPHRHSDRYVIIHYCPLCDSFLILNPYSRSTCSALFSISFFSSHNPKGIFEYVIALTLFICLIFSLTCWLLCTVEHLSPRLSRFKVFLYVYTSYCPLIFYLSSGAQVFPFSLAPFS